MSKLVRNPMGNSVNSQNTNFSDNKPISGIELICGSGLVENLIDF